MCGRRNNKEKWGTKIESLHEIFSTDNKRIMCTKNVAGGRRRWPWPNAIYHEKKKTKTQWVYRRWTAVGQKWMKCVLFTENFCVHYSHLTFPIKPIFDECRMRYGDISASAMLMFERKCNEKENIQATTVFRSKISCLTGNSEPNYA